ncbi:MAG: hypothetical protein OMM_08123 [Candidatus Magnetoglobus multicellularis str. Araruama]|uniref:Uncharacterized protein n=1 Tax=Candidatus Magnetoglobus multicellularis str. Araruama TaxID=890399 RepID=A0A1V1P9B4_9BACT|nr:MAG: hypothetical protein OMM_08123 [Candidatus Magnetoglobus multicellularis str. Araruama]
MGLQSQHVLIDKCRANYFSLYKAIINKILLINSYFEEIVAGKSRISTIALEKSTINSIGNWSETKIDHMSLNDVTLSGDQIFSGAEIKSLSTKNIIKEDSFKLISDQPIKLH